MQFIRSTTNLNVYTVFRGETYIGRVRRNDAWTVRGTRVTWVGTRDGGVRVSEPTRKAAAEALARTLAA
jgi:hypothetical protein